MNRTELERLDRDSLITHAESAGVERARILTRPELIDELLLRASRSREDVARARGLFGRARDLLARVIERGLHLPDAADRLRGRPPPPATPRSNAAPVPTVTLAGIYAAQGHRDRAVETLKNVLDNEPEHAVARTLIDQLEDAAYAGPMPPALPPETDLPTAAADEPPQPPPPRQPPRLPTPRAPVRVGTKHDTDECIAFPASPGTLFVYWDVSDGTRDRFLAAHPGGTLAIRVLLVEPTWDGPASVVRDLDVASVQGDSFVKGVPEGVHARVAVGWSAAGKFHPVAHSPALELETDGEGRALPGALKRWTLAGTVPLGRTDRDAASIERAFGAAKAKERGRSAAETGTPG
jgi:hypothetical protein